MKEAVDLEQYCSRFQGIARVFKQTQAATLLRSPANQIAFENVSIYAQQNGIYHILKYIENIAVDLKLNGIRFNKEIGTQIFQKCQAQADKLDKDIILYKNQQNKLSAGLSYIELGNLHLELGDVTEAFRSYERVHNYYESGDIYSYYLNWSACMLIERRYDLLRSISPKEQIPQDRLKRQQHTTLFIFQALRCLYQGNAGEFLLVIKDCIQHDSIVEDPTLLMVSNLREIGVVITMIALTRYSRTQVQELLQNESIRFFVSQDDSLIQILESYISLDYFKLTSLVRPILNEYQSDFLFSKFAFTDIFAEKITRQFLQPYKKISLEKVVKTLGMETEICLQYLKKLIINNQINFLYDPIDQVLVQKVTEKSKKYTTYETAVATISDYLQKRQFKMLQYQLSNIQQESYQKKLQDKDGNFMFSKFTKQVAGFFKQEQEF